MSHVGATLCFNGKNLRSVSTLAEIGVVSGDTLQIVTLSVRGGGCGASSQAGQQGATAPAAVPVALPEAMA